MQGTEGSEGADGVYGEGGQRRRSGERDPRAPAPSVRPATLALPEHHRAERGGHDGEGEVELHREFGPAQGLPVDDILLGGGIVVRMMARIGDVMGESEHDFARDADRRANGSPASLALRELHALVRRTRFWPGFAAALVVVSVAGPFGTVEILTLPQRTVYWGVVGTATFFVGMFTCVWVGTTLIRWGMPEPLATLAGGLAAGPVVTAVVWALNAFWLDSVLGTRTADTLAGLMGPLGANTAVAVGLTFLYRALDRSEGESRSREASDEPTPGAPPAADLVISRLPAEKRGPLVRMAVQDHYVEVITTRGRHLLLMRLSDEAEAMGQGGVRVHRSHWVNPAFVAKAAREKGRWTLRMDGRGRRARGTHLHSRGEAGLHPRLGGSLCH